LAEVRRVARDLALIVDIDGTRRGLVRRWLLSMDRGSFMRTPAQLAALVGQAFDVAETTRWDVGLYTEVAFRCPITAPSVPRHEATRTSATPPTFHHEPGASSTTSRAPLAGHLPLEPDSRRR